MGANVSVMGVASGMGGLKESQAKFRKHHTEVGDALMNISGVGTVTGEMVDKDEPRPAYQFAEYPFMLYKPGEEEGVVVFSPREKAERIAEGWRIEPWVKPQIAVMNPAQEKKLLQDQNKALQAQVSQQNELLERQGSMLETLAARLEAIEARKK